FSLKHIREGASTPALPVGSQEQKFMGGFDTDLAAAQVLAPNRVVFIDAHVPDLSDLLNGLAPDERSFVLDASRDGLQQIADVRPANNLANLSTISIVSHGSIGEVTLGSAVITDATLAAHAAALAEIGAALGPGGTLQLFGCDIGQGSAGQQFVNDIAM